MPLPDNQRVTRLAPSPTGALHLGNARTFMINWALARQRGWRIAMRIEDLDTPRTKEGADLEAIADLRWLGMDWDGEAMYQLHDLTPYRDALDQLARTGRTYPCTCTRREIEQAQSAPHEDDHELRYPGTCRPAESIPLPRRSPPTHAAYAVRAITPDQDITFEDQLLGPQSINVQQQVGDFVVASKAQLPAYQLAVVIDDARQGVTDVLRGDDLVRSTARQMLIYDWLERPPRPRYWHVPLVLGEDGRRLAKRHGDTRIAHYREHGVDPQRLIGLLAWWCGIREHRGPMDSTTFMERFDIERLPREPVTFTQEDDAWLMA